MAKSDQMCQKSGVLLLGLFQQTSGTKDCWKSPKSMIFCSRLENNNGDKMFLVRDKKSSKGKEGKGDKENTFFKKRASFLQINIRTSFL